MGKYGHDRQFRDLAIRRSKLPIARSGQPKFAKIFVAHLSSSDRFPRPW
jgi:hypothetical protein